MNLLGRKKDNPAPEQPEPVDPDDPRSVVDPDCRVLGLEGLRVIDASIMPEVPRANTHLTCVMIGEVMAERLRRGR